MENRSEKQSIVGTLICLITAVLLSLPASSYAFQDPGRAIQPPEVEYFSREDASRVMTLREAVAQALQASFAVYDLEQQYLQQAYGLENAKRRLRTNVHFNSTLPGISQQITPDLLSQGGGDPQLVFLKDNQAWVYGGVEVRQPLITNGHVSLTGNLVGYDASRDLPASTVNSRSVQPSVGIRLNQPLFQYNEVKGQLRSAELSFESLRLRYTEEELRLVNEVSRQFYALFAQQSALELAVDRYRQSDRNWKSGLRRQEAGLIPETEVLQLEVTRANDLDAMESARNTLEQQQFQFNRLVGLPLEERVWVRANLDYEQIEVDIDRALDLAFSNRSDIRRAEIDLETRRIDLQRIVSQGRPNLQLNAAYDLAGNSSLTAAPEDSWSYHLQEALDQDNRSPNTNVSLTLSIPLFDWGRNESLVQRRLSEIRVLEEQAEQVRQDLVQTVTNRVRAVESAQRRLEIQNQNVEVARKSYDFTQKRFDRGEITTVELAQAQDQLNQTLTNRLNALISYELAKADLKEITLWDWETDQPAQRLTTPPQPFEHKP
ncbi:MAG: TolC family protein [bacterium]